MMRTLLLKTLYDKRWFILGWSLVVAGMVCLVMTFYPTFSETSAFDQIAQSVPDQLKGLIGDQASFKTIPGFIATQLYDIRIPLLLMIMCLVLAQSLALSEEEKGTLRTLASTPLSRKRILWERWAGGVLIIGAIIIATILGTLLGGALISESIPLDLVLRLAALSWLFGAVAFSITYGVGTATGKRGPTMAIGLLLTFGSFILTTFAHAVTSLKDIEHISLLHYYDTKAIVDGHFNLPDMWLLVGLIAIFMFIATISFQRRDIN